jgi:hypothetical protein
LNRQKFPLSEGLNLFVKMNDSTFIHRCADNFKQVMVTFIYVHRLAIGSRGDVQPFVALSLSKGGIEPGYQGIFNGKGMLLTVGVPGIQDSML